MEYLKKVAILLSMSSINQFILNAAINLKLKRCVGVLKIALVSIMPSQYELESAELLK